MDGRRQRPDQAAAERLRSMVAAIADDGSVVGADPRLVARAERIATDRGITVHDAAYVAAAEVNSARLVSCDIRDLVSRGLAVLPADALKDSRTERP